MTFSADPVPDLGDFQPPTLETLPEAVARNVAIARARTRARIMAVVKANEYGHGACTVAQGAVAAGGNGLARQTSQRRPSYARQVSSCRSRTPQCRVDLRPRPLLLVALVSPTSQGRSRHTNP